MGTRYARLFCSIFLMNFFVLLLFTGGRSAPTSTNITDVMKKDKELCDPIQFLYNSKYVKPCESLPYPTAPWDLNEANVNVPLCLGVYDTAYKICSSRLQINSTRAFDLEVEKFFPGKSQSAEQFCHNLKGFTSTYKKIDVFWEPLIRFLDSSSKCGRICFNLKDEIHPQCAILAWSKHITNIVNTDTTEPKSDHSMTNKLTSQTNSETTDIKNTELKTPSEAKETKEPSTKQPSNDNGNAESKFKSDNVPITNIVKTPDAQNPNSYVKASIDKDKIQKKNNSTLPETQAPLSVSDKDVANEKIESNPEDAKPVNNPQTSSVKNAASENGKKYVDEDKMEELNKNIDELAKPTTLSDNTQEHYDVNPEDDIDPAVEGNDDVEDTNQQSIDAGNRENENAQEPYEQKHSTQRFSTIRSEDSHFFTYCTVVTLVCIAGYIGYHNKQKIFAIVLEGRRSRNSRGRRRPSTANYRKLDCTLEEAVTSQCNSNVTHVIY